MSWWLSFICRSTLRMYPHVQWCYLWLEYLSVLWASLVLLLSSAPIHKIVTSSVLWSTPKTGYVLISFYLYRRLSNLAHCYWIFLWTHKLFVTFINSFDSDVKTSIRSQNGDVYCFVKYMYLYAYFVIILYHKCTYSFKTLLTISLFFSKTGTQCYWTLLLLMDSPVLTVLHLFWIFVFIFIFSHIF